MILDYENTLADGQALTASAASENIIDLGAAGDLGHGEPMGVLITVDVAADATTGDETYAFAIQKDTVSAFSSAEEVISKTITAANLTAGSQHILVVPPIAADQQYLRLYATLGGTTPTITITAHLLPLAHIQNSKAYADAL